MKTLTIILSSTLLVSGSLLAFNGFADDDDYGYRSSRLDVAPVTNDLYKEECGSCHFAYQPGLLPERSWRKMMSQLDNHFGENAELDEETTQALTNYLVANAADYSDYKRSRGIIRSIKSNDTPLRITEVRYFKRKHHEISDRMVKNNPEVGSFSKCAACHTNADKGSYNEHQVKIPGFGRWED